MAGDGDGLVLMLIGGDGAVIADRDVLERELGLGRGQRHVEGLGGGREDALALSGGACSVKPGCLGEKEDCGTTRLQPPGVKGEASAANSSMPPRDV